MVVTPEPVLTVYQPGDNSNVELNTPFLVTGKASDVSHPEPVAIASVAVQVDGGVPVYAKISIDRKNKNKNLVLFDFEASVQVSGGDDPHVVTVTATDERNRSATQSRKVFVGVPFAVDAPALLIDVVNFVIEENGQPTGLQPGDLTSLASGLSQTLAPLSDALSAYGLRIAGPNLIAGPATSITSSVRIGIWVEDYSFPVIPPNPPDFPLPRLPDKGANLSFAAIPFLPVPDPAQLTPTFAIAAPLGAMQRLANALLPALQESAAPSNAEISSIVVHSASEGIEVDINGEVTTPVDVSFTLAVKEALGILQLGSDGPADPFRTVPAVTSSSHDSTINGSIAALFGVLLPPLGIILAVISCKLSNKVAGNETSATATLKETLAAIPSLIPLSVGSLPKGFPGIPDFPRLVLTWPSFGTSPTGILGTGTTTLDGRDSSMVTVVVDAAQQEITGSAAELPRIVNVACMWSLINIVPDKNGLSWSVAGASRGSGSLDPSVASFTAPLHLPQPPIPGNTYLFSVTVTAVETSIKAAQPLTGSGSVAIRVVVNKASKNPPQ
jgi:hypothetical protein